MLWLMRGPPRGFTGPPIIIRFRVALGATHRLVLTAVFRRPLLQVAIGVLVGSEIVRFIVWGESGQTPVSTRQGLFVGLFVGLYAIVMLALCLLTCVVPTRRALGVEPTEGLRGDGYGRAERSRPCGTRQPELLDLAVRCHYGAARPCAPCWDRTCSAIAKS